MGEQPLRSAQDPEVTSKGTWRVTTPSWPGVKRRKAARAEKRWWVPGWRLRQENRLNLGDEDCSELRLHHYTPAWVKRAKLRLREKRKEKKIKEEGRGQEGKEKEKRKEN